MKLGEALAQLKKEKSRLARLISLRKDNVYVEKGKKTSFDPNKLGEEIETKIDKIRELKISIQKTNLIAKIGGDDLSLAEAIIMVGDIRSKIASLSKLFDEKRESLYRWKSKDEVEKISQLNEKEVDKEMENLEANKTKLDNEIQIANWQIDLVN